MKASKCEMCGQTGVGDYTICRGCCRELDIAQSVGCNHDFYEIEELGIKRCSYCDYEIPFRPFNLGQTVRCKKNIIGYKPGTLDVGVMISEGQEAVVVQVRGKSLTVKSASGDKIAVVRKLDWEPIK